MDTGLLIALALASSSSCWRSSSPADPARKARSQPARRPLRRDLGRHPPGAQHRPRSPTDRTGIADEQLQDPRRGRRQRQARAGPRRSQRADGGRPGDRRHPHRARPADHPRARRQGRQGRAAGAFRPAQGQGRAEDVARGPWSRRCRGLLGKPVAFADGLHRPDGARPPSTRCRPATSCCWKTRASTRARRTTTRPSPRRWPPIGDLYVNDAFSAAHRAHASTEGLAHLLPAFAGRTMQAELDALEAAPRQPRSARWRPSSAAPRSRPSSTCSPTSSPRSTLWSSAAAWPTPSCTRRASMSASRCASMTWPTPRARSSKRPKKAGCEIVLPVDGVVAREFKANAPSADRSPSTAIPADAMILDVGPKSVEAVNRAGSPRPRRWSGTARFGAFETDALRPGHRGGRRNSRPTGPRPASWSPSRAAAIRSRR